MGRRVRIKIYLVPGFFGFAQLGAYSYFHQVASVIEQKLAKKGLVTEVIEVDTIPTGSIRRRAKKLIEVIKNTGGIDCDHLHFVGHSAGGLDIRLLLSPNTTIAATSEEESIASKTRSVITLATPHHGTPMANFFTSLSGQNLLLLLSLMATSVPGRYGLYYSAKLLRLFSNIDTWVGNRADIIDNLSDRLWTHFKPEEGDMVWDYLRRIASDQGAMIQLTPEAMDLFNGAVKNHPNVPYFSFVTVGPKPKVKSLLPTFGAIYQSISHLLYTLCYRITAKEHRHYRYPKPSEAILEYFESALAFKVDEHANDGIVPTLSQLWGELGGIYTADHMDVVGQFQHIYEGLPYSTWMTSGSAFDGLRFDRLWQDISDVITKCHNGD